MKKQKISEIILVVLSIIVIYVLVRNNYKDIASAIIHANFLWIILALILYATYLVLQAIPFYEFARLYDKKINFRFFIYLIIVTNFFNGITPLATGGQPLQVYEIHKKKISVVDSTNIVIQNSIIYQLALVIWILLAIFINKIFNFFFVSKTLSNMAFIGLILNLVFLGALLLVSFSKQFNKKLINGIIKFLAKIHIVKDTEKQIKKWDKTCTDFYENSQVLLKNKGLVIRAIIYIMLAFAAYYAMPLCIAKALHLGDNLTIVATITMTSYVFLSSNYLPIPGATGGIEYSFYGYFKNFITGYHLKTLLILWRFLTYYLPTIIGGIVFNINSIKHTKKSE